MSKKNNNPNGKGGFRDHPEHINKNGAPKKENSFRSIYDNILEEKYIKIDRDGNQIDSGMTKKEALAHACFDQAIKGSFSHLKEITERLDGKIPDSQFEFGDNVQEYFDKVIEIIIQQDTSS